MNNVKKLIACLLMTLISVSLAGCSNDNAAKAVNANQPKSSVSMSYNSNQVDNASSEEETDEVENENKTVIDFGENTIFEGISVASDDNGEIICTEIDGALWYKIEDARFTTYNKLKRFVSNSSGSKKSTQIMSDIKNYFVDGDDGLYFVNGINGRGIESRKSYLLNDSDSLILTVSVSHNSECRKQTGITKSNINFVKKDGQWKIESLTLFY